MKWPSSCSHCCQFKLNGPASTKSPLHIMSSTCCVTPCATVHSFTVFWIQHPTSPRTCCHPRYSRGASCSRWRPVSSSLPVRWAEFAAGNTASQWCFRVTRGFQLRFGAKSFKMNLLILTPFLLIQLLRTNLVSHSNPPRKVPLHR